MCVWFVRACTCAHVLAYMCVCKWLQAYLICSLICSGTLIPVCSLSLRWHLQRKTGEVLRVVDRGTNSINNLLRCISLLMLVAFIQRYSVLSSRLTALAYVILHEWLALYSAFYNIHQSGILIALAWLVPHETAAVLAHSVHTIQPCRM